MGILPAKTTNLALRERMAIGKNAHPSREIFEFLMEKRRLHCINKEFGQKDYTDFLRHCAIKGWTDMAAHYLDLGAFLEGLDTSLWQGQERWPLLEACKNGHRDVIEVLLKYGANTCLLALEFAAGRGYLDIVRSLLQQGAELGDAISLAAAKGYGDVDQELLDHGADIKNLRRPLLVYAVEQERVSLFRRLVERGCDPCDRKTVAECVRLAKEQGLESMLQLLSEHGVNEDNCALFFFS